MLSIGWIELLIIAAAALFFIGPKQVPEMARKVARLIRDLTKAKEEWLEAFRTDESIKEIRDSIDEVRRSARAPVEEFRRALDEKVRAIEEQKNEIMTDLEVTEKMSLRETSLPDLDEPTELYSPDDKAPGKDPEKKK